MNRDKLRREESRLELWMRHQREMGQQQLDKIKEGQIGDGIGAKEE
jgi:hypothetical protein